MDKGRVVSLVTAVGLCLVTCLLLWLVGARSSRPVAAQGAVRYVAMTGSDGSPCTDPEQPCRTVQHAVGQADEGDVIKVAAGVYTDVHARPVPVGDPYPAPGGVISQVVYLDKGVTICGGYLAPGYADPPDPQVNVTTLDAQGAGRVFYIGGEISPTIEGLILTGGRAGSRLVEPGYGGGLYVVRAAVTIGDSAIQGNEAVPLFDEWEEAPQEGGQGGGLYVHAGTVTLIRTAVRNNDAWYGGGLYVRAGGAALLDCVVGGNDALVWGALNSTGGGGGLYLAGSHLSLTGSAVRDNAAGGAGGGLCLVSSSAWLVDNEFVGNGAVESFPHGAGGAGGGLLLAESQVTLDGNVIRGNLAGTKGGGLYLAGGVVVLTNNSVTGNRVRGGPYYGPGGGGSGVYVSGSRARLTNTTIQDNESWLAACAALCVVNSRVTLTNTILTDNESYPEEGGASLAGSQVTMVHATIAGNRGGDGSGLLVQAGSTLRLTNTIIASQTIGITVTPGSSASLASTVWGAGDWANDTDWGGSGTLVTGTRNVWGDPAFVAAWAGDYHIGPGSAALNAGIDVGVKEDIDGQARPDWCFPDAGADELLVGGNCYRAHLPLVMRASLLSTLSTPPSP